MNLGLDLGSHSFRAVWQQSNHLRARQCRATYAVLADSPAQRRVLEQAEIGYAHCEGHVVLMGDAAAEFSRLFQAPSLPLLPDGSVPQEDPLARQVLAALVEALLPAPDHAGEVCSFTSPGASLGKLGPHPERLDFFSRLIRLRGYTPAPLASGMAIVFAECVQTGFNGIGMTFGAAGCEFSLAHQGIEVCSASIPYGGDWIDEQFAQQTNRFTWDARGRQTLDLAAARTLREEFSGSLLDPVGTDAKLLAELHVAMLVRAAREAGRQLADSPRIPHPHPPFRILCSGGVARIPEFRELAQVVFREVPFPVEIDDVRIGFPSPYTTARGCLINAHLESRATRDAPRAA